MLTNRSGSDRAASFASLASAITPERTRFCSVLATVEASRWTWSWATLTWSWLSTNTSGRPNSSTAVTATARVENSSRRRTSARPRPAGRHAGLRLDGPPGPGRGMGVPCLVAPLEAEPDTAHGGDVARALGVVTELAAQPRDVHVEGLGGPPPFAVPHLAHDLFPGDHLAGLVHQHRQQVELLGSEVKLGVTKPRPAGLGVHPDALGHAGFRAAATEQGPDPGEELREAERLGDIVVRAGVEADHRVHLIGTRREDQDRHRLAFGAQAAADFQAVKAWQAEIEHDQVDPAGQGGVQGAGAVSRDVHVVALAPERTG